MIIGWGAMGHKTMGNGTERQEQRGLFPGCPMTVYNPWINLPQRRLGNHLGCSNKSC